MRYVANDSIFQKLSCWVHDEIDTYLSRYTEIYMQISRNVDFMMFLR